MGQCEETSLTTNTTRARTVFGLGAVSMSILDNLTSIDGFTGCGC